MGETGLSDQTSTDNEKFESVAVELPENPKCMQTSDTEILKDERLPKDSRIVSKDIGPFFLNVKPEGYPDGTRFLLIHGNNFSFIFDYQHNELEVLPNECRYIVSSRFIFISQFSSIRKFSLKLPLHYIDSILFPQNSSEGASLIESIKAFRGLPSPTSVLSIFMNSCIRTEAFLLSFCEFPPSLLGNDFYIYWFHAAAPLIHKLLPILLEMYTVKKPHPEILLDRNSFAFRILSLGVFQDDIFKEMILKLSKISSLYAEHFIRLLETIEFGPRLRFSLHTVYKFYFERTGSREIAYRQVSHILYSSGPEELFMSSEQRMVADEIVNMERPSSLSNRYLKVLENFSRPVKDFVEIEPYITSHDGLGKVMGFFTANVDLAVRIYQKMIRKYPLS